MTYQLKPFVICRNAHTIASESYSRTLAVMTGLSFAELLTILAIALILIGVPLAILLVVLATRRGRRDAD